MLGLARRAGRVESGSFSAEQAVRRGKARLVILSYDASENTLKKFTDMCRFRDIPFRVYADRYELGRSVGTQMRTVVAVTDSSFARTLQDIMEREETQNTSQLPEK